MIQACRVPHRLKVSGPYYEDFKAPPALESASTATAATAVSYVAAGATGTAAGPPLTVAQVQAKVEAAVAAVMGDVPGPAEPLVEAGLDSLGANEHPPSPSPPTPPSPLPTHAQHTHNTIDHAAQKSRYIQCATESQIQH